MSILLLEPAGKDYIWGGTRLHDEFGKSMAGDRLAETWELSCHADGLTRIKNGKYRGETLKKFLEDNPGACGEKCDRFSDFPLLIKLIDANDDLSIQVHPDDEYALKNENQFGKTEMWYIVDCEEGAYIYFGFSREIDAAEYRERILNGTLQNVLNKVEVHKGDCFFIKSGTVHAIGKGTLVAEVQQNSNVTYRVFDYDRTDKFGNKRQLHIEKAIEVSNLCPPEEENSGGHMASCEYFTCDALTVNGSVKQCADKTSFHSLLVTAGNGAVSAAGETISVHPGDSVFITAGSGEYTVEGKLTFVLTTV